MQTILVMWRLLLLLSLVGFPQLLGVLAYFRVRKHHDALAHAIGILVPPVLFFFLTHLMLSSSALEIESGGDRACGTFLGMMALAILFGTGVHLVFSVVSQLALHLRHRRPPSQAPV